MNRYDWYSVASIVLVVFLIGGLVYWQYVVRPEECAAKGGEFAQDVGRGVCLTEDGRVIR